MEKKNFESVEGKKIGKKYFIENSQIFDAKAFDISGLISIY